MSSEEYFQSLMEFEARATKAQNEDKEMAILFIEGETGAECVMPEVKITPNLVRAAFGLKPIEG